MTKKQKTQLDKFYSKAQDPDFDPVLELLKIILGLQGQVEKLTEGISELAGHVATLEAKLAFKDRTPKPIPRPLPPPSQKWRSHEVPRPWVDLGDYRPPVRWTPHRSDNEKGSLRYRRQDL